MRRLFGIAAGVIFALSSGPAHAVDIEFTIHDRGADPQWMIHLGGDIVGVLHHVNERGSDGSVTLPYLTFSSYADPLKVGNKILAEDIYSATAKVEFASDGREVDWINYTGGFRDEDGRSYTLILNDDDGRMSIKIFYWFRIMSRTPTMVCRMMTASMGSSFTS